MPRVDLLFVHNDLFVLAGNARAMLMLADMSKYLGYHALFLHSDVRPEPAWYWGPGELRKYHPVKYLDYPDCGGPHVGRICGDFYMDRLKYVPVRIYDYSVYGDWIAVTDDSQYIFYLACCPPAMGIHYVHYPDRPSGPREGKLLIFNSTYTQRLARRWWGVTGIVLHPPLWTDLYRCRPLDDRDIDVVFFGQMYKVKGFDLAELLAERGYTVAVIGAYVGDWEPQGNVIVYRNADFKTYSDVLSRSKVYVHARPGEHFGITITEAMASCTPVIVHRSGGQWSDVVEYGRYGMGWSTVEELLAKVRLLTSNREAWEYWSARARSRAGDFDVRVEAPRWQAIVDWLDNYRKELRRDLKAVVPPTQPLPL